MKRIFFGLFIISCILFSLPANSQIKFGVKLGTNFSQDDFDALKNNIMNEDKIDMNIKGTGGFFVGPMMDIKIPVLGFGLDAGFHYSLRRYSIDNATDDKSCISKQHSFIVPLNLKYNFGLGDVLGLYLTAGPLFEFNINPDSFWKDVTTAAANAIDGYSYEKKSTEVALSFGAGLKILNHIQVGFNYNLGLTDAARGSATNLVNAAWDNKAVKSREWQISAAYLF